MNGACLTHHSDQALEEPSLMPVEFPRHFEGPGHREAVLSAAMCVGALVDALELAHTDPLTSLYNRRGFNRAVGRLAELAEPHIALVYLDLDNFKMVNDTVGHDVGDVVLKDFTQTLAELIPVRAQSGEALARLGGDEFVAAISTVNTLNNRREKRPQDEIINGFIERIEGQVHTIAERIGVTALSVSVGVAVFRDEGHEDESVEEFIARADREMYAHKQSKVAP